MSLKEAFKTWSAECVTEIGDGEMDVLEEAFHAGAAFVHRRYSATANGLIARQRRALRVIDGELRTYAVAAALRHAETQGARRAGAGS